MLRVLLGGRGAFHLLAIRVGDWLCEMGGPAVFSFAEVMGSSSGLGRWTDWLQWLAICSSSSCVDLLLSLREGGIDEEVGEAGVGVDWSETGGIWGKTASRGTVSWVEGTWDVAGEEDGIGFVSEVMKAAESKVDVLVA
jgi:hypothetical protein